jgi:hypothetical protein
MHQSKAPMYPTLYFLLVTIGFVLGGNVSADAQILATPNIEELCKSAPTVTYRRTLVYVDLAAIEKGKTEWGLTILNRLELGPREWLTVLGVNPSTFEINQVFDSCYPALTKGELEEGRDGRGFWDKLTKLGPADQQRENLQTFDARLRNSLDKLIANAEKFERGKRRNMIGAIAFDKNRFSDRSALYRVIIFTDGSVVEADLDAGADVARQIGFLTAKYPASFFGADISIFGVSGSDETNGAPGSNERVVSAFFLKSWAHLRSFSSSLPQQRNDLFPAVNRLDGTFEGGGTQGAAKLAYSRSSGGSLSEAWVVFVVGQTLLYVPLEGEFQCEGEQCKIMATSTETIPLLSPTPYFRKGDRLLLQGKRSVGFEGSLGAETREVFKDGTQEVKYNLKFLKP